MDQPPTRILAAFPGALHRDGVHRAFPDEGLGEVGIQGAVGVQAGKSWGIIGARRGNEIAADENLVREVGVIMGIDVDAADLASDLGSY